MQITKVTTKQQLEHIALLASTIWQEHYVPIIGKAQVDYMLETFQSVNTMSHQIDAGFLYFLIYFEDTPIGYLSVKPEDNALFLSKIYVLNTYRGKGIGTQAMTFVENMAKDFKLPKIRLTVNKHNTNSIQAYKTMGFIIVGDLVADIGNGFVMDDFEMEKIIDN